MQLLERIEAALPRVLRAALLPEAECWRVLNLGLLTQLQQKETENTRNSREHAQICSLFRKRRKTGKRRAVLMNKKERLLRLSPSSVHCESSISKV
jgi:hypothetical protein